MNIDIKFGVVFIRQLPPELDADGNMQPAGQIYHRYTEGLPAEKRYSPPAVRIVYK